MNEDSDLKKALLLLFGILLLAFVSGVLGFIIGRHFPRQQGALSKQPTIVPYSETADSAFFSEEILPNETLEEIADRHGITTDELRKVNPGLPEDGKLKPFSTIKVPAK